MQESMPTLRDYLIIVLNGKKKIILATFISILAAAAVSLFLPAVYEATALIYVQMPIVKTEFRPEFVAILGDQSTPSSRFATQLIGVDISLRAWEEIIKGQDILRDIINKLKLKNMTFETLGRMLKVERLEEKRAYQVLYYAPAVKLIVKAKKDPRLASDIANTWAELCIKKFSDYYSLQLEEMYKFTFEEFKAAKDRFQKAQNALIQFKNSSKKAEVMSLDEELKNSSLERDLDEARASYELFRQKAEQSKISLVEGEPKAVLISRAVEPEEKVAPKRLLIVGLAGLAGFLISVFFVIGAASISKD